jgi:hypothetical protein
MMSSSASQMLSHRSPRKETFGQAGRNDLQERGHSLVAAGLATNFADNGDQVKTIIDQAGHR